jgi:putative ABC transport system permease protein
VTPPRLATRALEALIGARGWRETVLGDLHEEYVARACSRRVLAGARADGWYWLQAAAIGARYGAARVFAARGAHNPGSEPRRGDSLMRTIGLELRYALRMLVKRRALSALVVLTLALGLGANAVIFEAIDALVLRPFTIPDIDRLVMVSETGTDVGTDIRESVSPANFIDWKQSARSLDCLAAFEWWSVNFAGGNEPERVAGFRVTEGFFETLGVQAALGRTFTADEATPGRDRSVVISHALWQRRFGGDPSLIGRIVLIDAEPYEVVGIAPRGFNFPMGTDLWGPLGFDAATAGRRTSRYLSVIGRLAPGRTLDDAKAEIAVIASQLERQFPEANKDHGARAWTLVAGMRDQGLGPILALWQASAAFVLLIACANIANLLLTLGAERQRELAVRLAIGASRARLVREQLIESVVMAAAAVPLALAFAWLGVRLIRINMPPRIMRFVDGWQSLDVDGRLVVFTGLLALGTAIVFGTLPALHASRPQLTDALKDGGRGSTAGRQRQRLRRTLVVAEIALALPLLVASALGAIGAQRFINGPQGYDPDGLLTMRVGLPEARYAAP